jgi:hypothetical protein
MGWSVVGALVAGHCAQRLFGWFEGLGLRTWTSVMDERMGMRPAAV